MIQFRPNAEKELLRLLSKQQTHPLVRLNIVSGGCLEWTYQLTLADTFNPQEETAYQFASFTLVLPNAAIPHLQDLTIDYAEDLMGGGFRFFKSQRPTDLRLRQLFRPKRRGGPQSPPRRLRSEWLTTLLLPGFVPPPLHQWAID